LVAGTASLPPHLETALQGIPDGPGVYLFYGESAQPLYVGKSIHLRTRVLSHFQADHKSGRDMRLAQETRRVTHERTAGELGALLRESQLVKQWQPAYNRKLRRTPALCVWQIADAAEQRPQVRLIETTALVPRQLGQVYGIFKSAKAAREALLALADGHGLCARLLGLEAGTGRCFGQQVGRCAGACCGLETLEKHLLRVRLALAAHKLQDWPFTGPVGLREHDTHSGRTDIHVFDHWCHLATVQDEAELHEVLSSRQAMAFDIDTYGLLRKRLALGSRVAGELLRFKARDMLAAARE
jgi:DNA polymerase-3 subunit epsilon